MKTQYRSFDDIVSHPWLTIRLQIALGAVFVMAALPKIIDPPTFAHMIYNYKILPLGLVNIAALVLPWVELIIGIALILGMWRGTAITFVIGLLVIFILAIGYNLLIGNAIDCGCFDPAASGLSDEEKLSDMVWTIIRDLFLLAMAVQVLIGWLRERRLLNGGPSPFHLAGPPTRSMEPAPTAENP
ncbi:MAG: DoxX family protein [Acidobacteria bacterium]|nr:DoxX family protein [Acidobacteriota bacterium]